MKFVLLIFTLLTATTGFAAKFTAKAEQKPNNILKSNGALRGGKAGDGFSLLDLRSTVAKNSKTERLVLDIGNAAMQNLKGTVGYYNVELRKNKQVLIDLTQTLNSKVTEEQLVRKLSKSPFIKKATMQFDPLTQNTSLVLDLKKSAQVKVLSVKGAKKTARIVVDLMESKIK